MPNRDWVTLEPIIEPWLLPGTHIITDGWAAYNHLDALNNGVYLHDTVIHEHYFVDPVHGWLHTNTIEGKWMHAKEKVRVQHGTSRELFPSYLDEYMYRKNAGGHNIFRALINSIRQFYPM